MRVSTAARSVRRPANSCSCFRAAAAALAAASCLANAADRRTRLAVGNGASGAVAVVAADVSVEDGRRGRLLLCGSVVLVAAVLLVVVAVVVVVVVVVVAVIVVVVAVAVAEALVVVGAVVVAVDDGLAAVRLVGRRVGARDAGPRWRFGGRSSDAKSLEDDDDEDTEEAESLDELQARWSRVRRRPRPRGGCPPSTLAVGARSGVNGMRGTGGRRSAVSMTMCPLALEDGVSGTVTTPRFFAGGVLAAECFAGKSDPSASRVRRGAAPLGASVGATAGVGWTMVPCAPDVEVVAGMTVSSGSRGGSPSTGKPNAAIGRKVPPPLLAKPAPSR